MVSRTAFRSWFERSKSPFPHLICGKQRSEEQKVTDQVHGQAWVCSSCPGPHLCPSHPTRRQPLPICDSTLKLTEILGCQELLPT